ncbi:uncharacterized protein [Epargyreus clarus]|uniref:uncharacterized protein n=1 Tax=Epargyreus clarus TaxID=520877 RepID=UPI003C2FF26B
MSARVFLTSILIIHATVSKCAVHRENDPEIISKSKIELTPILITSVLNDIVILSAPYVNAEGQYYLHKPNGDAIELNLNKNKDSSDIYNDLAIKNTKGSKKNSSANFQIFDVNNTSRNDNSDDFAEKETQMEAHDFMIGPLQEEDHGNWVLSAYYKDIDGHWVEMFQVITIEIVETVPLLPEKSQLYLGEPFGLSFAYPIKDLQSCQIIPPKTTFDRFYARTTLNTCKFVMKNVTSEDTGSWTIIGVGNIVYKGSAFLQVGEIIK